MGVLSNIEKGAITGYDNFTKPIPNFKRTILGECGSALVLIAGIGGTLYLYPKDPFRSAQFAVAVASALGYYKGSFGGVKFCCDKHSKCIAINRVKNLGFSLALATGKAALMGLNVTVSSPLHVLALTVGAFGLGVLAGGMASNEFK